MANPLPRPSHENPESRDDDDPAPAVEEIVEVIFPALDHARPARIMSPRLARKEDAAFFVKQVIIRE